jgi:hypothetical protein
MIKPSDLKYENCTNCSYFECKNNLGIKRYFCKRLFFYIEIKLKKNIGMIFYRIRAKKTGVYNGVNRETLLPEPIKKCKYKNVKKNGKKKNRKR